MKLLTAVLPETVNIGGVEYPINTDFRAGVLFEVAILKGEKDVITLLSPFFSDKIPADITGALEAICKFHCCGETEGNSSISPKHNKQTYSFEADESVIFADFRNYYGVDLTREHMHWWAFRALLESLPEKSEFKQRIYYRTLDSSDLKGYSKKERERLLKIKARLELKTENGNKKMTLEERNAGYLKYIEQRYKKLTGG